MTFRDLTSKTVADKKLLEDIKLSSLSGTCLSRSLRQFFVAPGGDKKTGLGEA
jgi:hypothetical protein